MRYFLYLLLTAVSCVFHRTYGQVPIIPVPNEIDVQKGEFIITAETKIIHNDAEGLLKLINYFQKEIASRSALKLETSVSTDSNFIVFKIEPQLALPDEGYKLAISPKGITIRAASIKGLFYGTQSILQLIPTTLPNHERINLPYLQITDYPQLSWRGLMLDVSRHFYSIEALKDIIDLLAYYKMNVFHWHLTDNEGWRLEIKKYPKLTAVAAWRNEIYGSKMYEQDSLLNWNDTYRYGGYYSQEDAKELVAYAAERHVTIVPEIEMPGHSGAVLAAYPQFSCSQSAQTVPNSALFNKFNPAPSPNQEYCAGNDSSFLFLQDVLKEVMTIFPSPYIHIGGDEVDKTHWRQCALCKKRMQDERIADESGLQSYFIKRIAQFLETYDRKLVGWDEILEGGLAKNATVMSWRGEKGGIMAAHAGHEVILSPSDPFYLNRYQADPAHEPFAAKYSINTLERVYQYNPYPNALNLQQRKYVKGIQVALWNEFISNRNHLEYMLLPRLPAAAEVAWSKQENKNFEKFIQRLNLGHFQSWILKGYNFHPYYYKQ